MAKVLEALIAKGRRVQRAIEQKEVAFGLADLSTHEELLERMVQKGGIKSLLLLITRSKDRDAQRFSALALANISSAAFNRSKIADEGTIPTLINIMKDTDSDIICRQYCAMALGNLAAEPNNHLEIVKCDGIESLLAVLRTEDIDAGRYAAFALANIGANSTYRERIVELGAIPSLISLACSEDINAQRQALAGLRSICIAPEFRAVVVREGIMDPLVLLSRVEDIEILREVTAAINCLSSIEENKIEIADRAMSTIIGLMLSGDIVIERHALCAAANLMEMPELHARLTEERGVAPVVAIAASLDDTSRGEACRCLANLSVNPDMHQLIIREGSLIPLIGALSKEELNCQRYSALCLANISTTIAAQVKVIQNGAIKPLINLCNDSSYQIEARRYAALALANLTATAANHITVIEEGGLQSFFSLCNSPDLMSQYYVGCALANLSCSIGNHFIVVEQGGLQALITLVSSQDPDVHQQAAAALRGLSVTTENKMKIVQEGALSPLTLLLSSDDVEILREVVACFCNLSVSDENKLEIVKCGTIAIFISLSQSTDMIVSSMACATLANLAELKVNQELIVAEGAVRPTVACMRSKFIEVQREAGRLLANLCASDSDNVIGIVEAGGHNLLISYLLSQDTACQRVGSMGICNLCTQSRFRKSLMECGAVEPLCTLARSEDVELEIQRYSILSIANLASATEIHHIFVEEGMLSLLISLATANDAEIRQYASYAVTKIAQNADVRKEVTEEGGLEPVLYLSRTDEVAIQAEVLPALCSLSFADANKISICRNGGLDAIVRAITDKVAKTSRLACCAIANLSEVVENFDLIHKSMAIPALIQQLQCPFEDVKCEIARALGNLSANIEFGDIILRDGALKYLIPMLQSQDLNTQRITAFALANLSSNSRNLEFILNNGLFEVVISEIKESLTVKARSDFESTRYCLLILSNIAVNTQYHPQLMKFALPLLAQYSKHRDIKCRQHALFCIANLCINKDNLEDIMASGSLRSIITYAFPSSDVSSNIQFQAVSALRGLATHPSIRIQIVRDGALEPLIMSAKSPSIEVQREVAATICNISLAEENKIALARGGALPALIGLAMSADRVRELFACAAIANIAEMVEGRTQERMIDEGILRPLLRLTESDDPEIRREVSRALALFASKTDSHSTLLQVHAPVRMLSFLKDTDDIVKRFGALGIANLAVSRDTHQDLFDIGAISQLMEVASAPDVATRRTVAFGFNNIASNPNNHIACERLGIMRPLIVLVRDKDKDTNLQAVIAVRRLCESHRCRNQFVEFLGIESLLQLGQTEDVELRREVAAALRNLSLSEHCKVAIVKDGGLGLICDMLHSPDVEICHQSSGIIANLAETTENQGVMVDAGIIQHIKHIMRSNNVDIQREASRALANISAEFSFAPQIVAAGALLALISTMSSPDFLCQRYAVMGIGNLATNPINQKKILFEGGLPPLLSIARFENGDLESQRYAAIAITNLSATKSNHGTMIETGCLDLMCTLLSHEDAEIRSTCALFIANFASNQNTHSLLMKIGCVPTMIQLLSNQDRKVQLYAVQCIRGLSTDADIRLTLIEAHVLTPLLELSKSENIEMQMETLATLCNLSLSGCIGNDPDLFLDTIKMQNLIAFLCSADNTYRLFGAITIGNIASSRPLQEAIVKSGALSPLISVANAADLETQRCISYAICNLASDPLRRNDIVREAGLSAIISLACSEDENDQLTALATLRSISTMAENRRIIYQSNIIEAIILGSLSGNFEIKIETASILCALSLNDENKLDMVHNSDILKSINQLLISSHVSDCRALRPVLACVANISERTDCHDLLVESIFSSITRDIFDLTDVCSVREATRLISNITSMHTDHVKSNLSSYINWLSLACEYNDAVVTRFGVIGFLNLSTLVETHQELRESNIVNILVSFIVGKAINLHVLDSLGNLLESDTRDLDDLVSPRSKLDLEFIQQYGYDRDCRRYSALCIGNLLTSSIFHELFITSECLEAIIDCLNSDDLETRFNASFALSKLTQSDSNALVLSSVVDLFPKLIHLISKSIYSKQDSLLVSHNDEEDTKDILIDTTPTVVQVISVLRQLAGIESNRELIIDCNVLEPLTIAAQVYKKNFEIIREITALCCLLSLSESTRQVMVSSPLIESLLEFCSYNDIEISRQACGVFANLAESKKTHKRLASIGVMHNVIFTMSSKHVSVHREASRAISNLLTSNAFHSFFLDDGGLTPLFRLCKTLDVETLYNCAVIYRKLASIHDNHDFIIGKGGLMALLNLTRTLDLKVNRLASAAIRDLSSNPKFKIILSEEGVLRRAIELSSDVDLELKILGIGTLRHLSVNSRVKRPIVEQGGLGPIFLAVEDKVQDIDLLRQCSSVLQYLLENTENQISFVHDGVLPRLVHLSSVNDMDIQRDVAKAFASLSSNLENLNNVFGSIEIQSILSLVNACDDTKNDGEICCRDALVSLGNLSSSDSNQLLIFQLGGLSHLLRAAKSRYESCHIYVCRCLYRLASHRAIQPSIIDAGFIPLLNAYCNSASMMLRKYAIMSICNVATNEDIKHRLGELQCFEPLMKLLKDSEEVVSRYAVMSVINLSTDSSNQKVFVESGILPILINLANLEETETARFAGLALSNLSCNHNNRIAIVEFNGLVPIIRLALSKSLESQRAGSLALYNLSCSTKNHTFLVQGNAISTISLLCQGNDLECKRTAIMTLANLAANVETRVLATKSNGLQTAIAMLKDDDLECRRYACICLCNMANSTKTQEQIVVHGALPLLLEIVNDSSDPHSQQHALLTINNIASNDSNHYALVQKGAIQVILKSTYEATVTDSLDSKVDDNIFQLRADLKEYAAFVIANMCGNSDYLSYVGRIGGIEPLMELSRSLNNNTLCLSLAALRRLAHHEDNWARLIQLGILDSLAQAGLYNDDLDIKREVAACLCSLSLSKPHRIEIAHKCLSPLLHLLNNNTDQELLRQVTGGLANLAEDFHTHGYFEVANAWGSLIQFLQKYEVIDILREVSRVVANLLTSFRYHDHFIIEVDDLCGIYAIIRMASLQDDVEIIYNTAVSLRKLTPNLKTHNMIVKFHGFQVLFKMIQYENINIQRQSASALRDLVANPDYKLTCYNLGGIDALLKLVHHNDETLQAIALSCFRHLSIPEDLKERVFNSSSNTLIRRVLTCIKSINDDIFLQAAGLLANLSEANSNTLPMVDESIVVGLVNLAYSNLEEVRQDTVRALANLASNEETHVKMFKQGALNAFMRLSTCNSDISQQYTAIGLRFLVVNPDLRVQIVQEGQATIFINFAYSELLEYRRTAAIAFSSFTLNDINKKVLIRQEGCIAAILSLARQIDLITKRDAVVSLSNLCSSLEYQLDMIHEGILETFNEIISSCDDARIQREVARSFSTLAQHSDIQNLMMNQLQVTPDTTNPNNLNCLASILILAKSLDVPCQRYATLALCNICSSDFKMKIVEEGQVIKPLIFLSRFPDPYIQKYVAMSFAGLALGGHGMNKEHLINEGCMKSLVDLIRFPDREVQLAALIGINCIVLGPDIVTKNSILVEHGMEPLLTMLHNTISVSSQLVLDLDLFSCIIYLLGSLAEHDDLKTKLVESNVLENLSDYYFVLDKNADIIKDNVSELKEFKDPKEMKMIQFTSTIIDVKRAFGYFFAGLSEHAEYHDIMFHCNVFKVIISLATLEDIECQEYAAFSLAYLASNTDYQVELVKLGAIRPLVMMMSSDAEPKHYAGLALLKLAENFENHIKIAEAGGIQALLRLGRSKSTDEQVHYKTALTLGQLASNAVKLIDKTSFNKSGSNSITLSDIPRTAAGTGLNAMRDLGLVGTKRAAGETVIGHGARILERMKRNNDQDVIDNQNDINENEENIKLSSGLVSKLRLNDKIVDNFLNANRDEELLRIAENRNEAFLDKLMKKGNDSDE